MKLDLNELSGENMSPQERGQSAAGAAMMLGIIGINEIASYHLSDKEELSPLDMYAMAKSIDSLIENLGQASKELKECAEELISEVRA